MASSNDRVLITMRILITGARGQLGLALRQALEGDDVLALDHTALDVSDTSAARRAVADARPEVVLHAAAWTDTAGCERDPERAMRENAGGAASVAAACREAGAPMLYVSTNEVFDGAKGMPYAEDDATNPLNAYGRSKLAGEEAVRAALPEHWVVRTSWLYGPGRTSFPEKILATARANGHVRVVTDETASPTWTRDLAAAIARLIRTHEYGVFHLANGGECSRKDWAVEVLRLAGVEVPVEPVAQADLALPYVKPAVSTLANSRAAALGIGLRPWREALADHMLETGQAATASRRSVP
jgi:dTDP-4-dehydrorhamnose reductase